MQSFVIPHKVHGTHRIFYNKKRAHARYTHEREGVNINFLNFLYYE